MMRPVLDFSDILPLSSWIKLGVSGLIAGVCWAAYAWPNRKASLSPSVDRSEGESHPSQSICEALPDDSLGTIARKPESEERSG